MASSTVVPRSRPLTLKVTATYRLLPSAINIVRAILDVNFGQLRQRHPLAGRGEQTNIFDGLRGIPIRRLVAHHHVVPLLADQHLAHGIAAHGGLDGVLYVRHVDSKSGRLRAVDG